MRGRPTWTLIAPLMIGCSILAAGDLRAQCCPGGGYIAGELIVGFQDGTTLETVMSVAASAGSIVKRRVLQSSPVYLLGVPIGEEFAFIPTFEALPAVRYAEANAFPCGPGDPPCTCCPCGLQCSTLPDSCPDCAGAIPDGTPGQGAPLTVDGVPGGGLRLSWGASCSTGGGDYAVYEGSLGDFSSHVPVACSTGGMTTLTFAPAAGDAYYLVVPRSATFEGSYGADSRRLQRPPSSSACLSQGIATSCM